MLVVLDIVLQERAKIRLLAPDALSGMDPAVSLPIGSAVGVKFALAGYA